MSRSRTGITKIQGRETGKFTAWRSNCVAGVNFNPVEGTLEITFHNPTVGKWRYFNVDPFSAAGLLSASSKGWYFNRYIRDNYSYERVE